MGQLTKKIKHLAGMIPPIRRLLSERDALREQNANLRGEVGALTHELKVARAKFFSAWKHHPDLWTPPGHHYSPIPAVSSLRMHEEEIFAYPPGIRGVDLNEQGQLDLLKRLSVFYPEQPFKPQSGPDQRYFFENPNYSYNDAIVLYCMMRHLRPQRIVEIGSGFSSSAILDVNERFFDNAIACTFIDPYPQLLKDLIRNSDHQRVRILGQKVQDADVSTFQELGASDILFIDSSHVAKTGSDVNYIVFKILPLLRDGVYIHFHDIFYPFEYPKEWVYEGRAWNEAYIVRAFLQYNRAFEIQFFNSFLMEKHRDIFEREMPLCLKRMGANLWLKKIVHDTTLDRAHAETRRTPPRPPSVLDLSRQEHTFFLGDGWYEPELEHCWMAQEASFQIAGPLLADQRIEIRAISRLNGARLTATADGISLGETVLGPAGDVAPTFPLPESLIGRPAITVELKLDRFYEVGGDPRKLGLAVTRIQVI